MGSVKVLERDLPAPPDIMAPLKCPRPPGHDWEVVARAAGDCFKEANGRLSGSRGWYMRLRKAYAAQ